MQTKNCWLLLVLIGLIVVIGSWQVWSDLPDARKSNQEFSNFLEAKKELPTVDEEVSLIATGDIMLSRTVAHKMKTSQDINYPFLKVAGFLQSADITFGNLENPIVAGPPVIPLQMRFRADPGVEASLKKAGFDVLSLANNHLPDYGEKGIIDSLTALQSVDIATVGVGKNAQEANRPAYIKRKGLTFAFLAYNDSDVVPAKYEASESRAGTAFMRTETMIEAVKKTSLKADFVIVSMHSGAEYTLNPNAAQINFARSAIDAGAELVIGHHPHVVQPIERYKGKYIFYSLGNFVFDQIWDDTKAGLMTKILFNNQGITKIDLHPIEIHNWAQPQFANQKVTERVLERLQYDLDESLVFEWDQSSQQMQRSQVKMIVENRASRGSLSKSVENYILKDGKLKIQDGEKVVWGSPDDWWIDDFNLSDSTNDRSMNINLSVWKSGSFGSSKPFWVEEEDLSVKNHFFVFELKDGLMKSVWQSSNLDNPNCEFLIEDIDNDGKNELIVIEGSYRPDFKCQGEHLAVWRWNGWGFSNEWRSEKGNFQNLRVVEVDSESGMKRIIVEKF